VRATEAGDEVRTAYVHAVFGSANPHLASEQALLQFVFRIPKRTSFDIERHTDAFTSSRRENASHRTTCVRSQLAPDSDPRFSEGSPVPSISRAD